MYEETGRGGQGTERGFLFFCLRLLFGVAGVLRCQALALLVSCLPTYSYKRHKMAAPNTAAFIVSFSKEDARKQRNRDGAKSNDDAAVENKSNGIPRASVRTSVRTKRKLHRITGKGKDKCRVARGWRIPRTVDDCTCMVHIATESRPLPESTLDTQRRTLLERRQQNRNYSAYEQLLKLSRNIDGGLAILICRLQYMPSRNVVEQNTS